MTGHTLLHVLLALAAIVLVARLFGLAFERVGQPAVIGEVIAGIVLGPSVLGRFWPKATSFLLPPHVAPLLSAIAQVGVILFMFLVGIELDTAQLRRKTRSSIAISWASIVVPFGLGVGLAWMLRARFAPPSVPFVSFALFVGVSMSVTAFPVLARILTDRNLQRTPLGIIALSCAAVDDVTAWCLLAFVVAVVKSDGGAAVRTVIFTFIYLALMIVAVRPLVLRWVARIERAGTLDQTGSAIVFVALLLSALATEAIGIHALFGAFFLGTLVPHDSVLARELATKLHDLVVVLLLPAFFAFNGLRTQLGLVSGVEQWLLCGLIIVIASVGKFGGSFVAARLTGLDRRDAACIAILMNTRGLMELIVLNVGLDLGVLTPTMFAMMVVMAVVTTLMTAPVLQWLRRGVVEEVGDRSTAAV